LFKPVNRYVAIKLADQRENMTESGIMLPADFKPKEERYVAAQVINWSPEVRFEEDLAVGTIVVVDKSMVEEINIKNETINIVLDNYIVGIIQE
jgi:co-chaperonin GroES (HSP10)